MTATRLSDGKTLELQTVSLDIVQTLDSPAMSLSGIFAVHRHPGELVRVRACRGKDVLFEGEADVQRTLLSDKGRLLELEARSKGAALLDNEAAPRTLTNLHLATLFAQCAAPYGFVLNNPRPAGALAEYTVHKGLSEWEALCGYVRRMHGLTPYVSGDMVVVDKPRSLFCLPLGGGDYPISRIEHRIGRYEVLSRISLRDREGNYSVSVANPVAAGLGIRRRRYVIPAGEFADLPALDADTRIRNSMRARQRTGVTLPGILPIPIGQQVSVEDESLTLRNLYVHERRWSCGENGLQTRLTLLSTLYL